MTTIMSWGNSDGTKGLCDGKCHNAEGTRCRCMCGGRFHGAARQPGGVVEVIRKNWEEAIGEVEAEALARGAVLDLDPMRELCGLTPQHEIVQPEPALITKSASGETKTDNRETISSNRETPAQQGVLL